LPEVHYNLGNALNDKGCREEAIGAYRQAIALRPGYAEAYGNLGMVLDGKGLRDEAIAAYLQAIALRPHYPEAHYNLGNALKDKGQPGEAAAAYRRAIALRPHYPAAFNNLGNVLNDAGQLEEAVGAYRQAIALQPNYPVACNNLGNALRDNGQLNEAVEAYRQAMALRPNYAAAICNMGNALKDMGQLDEALAAYRQAVALEPGNAVMHSNLVYMMQFHPGCDAAAVAEEAQHWNVRHAAPLRKEMLPHANDRSPGRRLRIGYVSPDFRNHVVGRFLLPLVEQHDHREFEIFGYADVPVADGVTQRLRACADAWRSIVGRTDREVAEMIRADGIDVLVDLSLHMAGNRLLAFARKPAPVQVSWLGYPGTTGLEAMDYRLTNAHLDPPGVNDAFYSERCVRLPEACCCYQPTGPTPEVNALPARTAGHITLGCLNNFCKVSPAALAAWIRILHAVPRSHLLLHAYAGSHRQRMVERLEREGIAPERIQFVGFGGAKYFEFYHGIDMVLDPFPYGGGTTTCEALWMGVPVITLAGKAACSRMGLDALTSVGLPEFICHSEEEYVEKARGLALDEDRLAELRGTIRRRMQTSALMDAPRFARQVEAAFREMWRRWCGEVGDGGLEPVFVSDDAARNCSVSPRDAVQNPAHVKPGGSHH